METKRRSIIKIKKERLKELTFNSKDVFPNKMDQERRAIELRKAVSYHTNSPKAVQIIFECSDGCMMVEAEELRLNKEYVSLMDGCFIPLRNILTTKTIFN